jgi:three-Cys-motif partner protein
LTRTTQEFGDEHTKKKLETVEKYLKAFTTALKKRDFTLYYVDACAGSGSSAPKPGRSRLQAEGQVDLGLTSEFLETDRIIEGSAVRALGINPLFDRYLFNDLKRSNVRSLKSTVEQQFPHLGDRIEITQQDANSMLRSLCIEVDWKSSRAVVFLDPFGLQIKFETLCELARTKAIDLWYLVPVFAMYRQVRGDGQILSDGGKSVDDALGTTDWRNIVAIDGPTQVGLFGEDYRQSARALDIAGFERIAMDRLRIAFGGRVVDRALPLGRNGLHEFSLVFAWANPSEPARLAAKLATAVLK